MKVCLLVLIFINIYQLKTDFAEDEFEVVVHVKLTEAIRLAGKCTWLTTQLPELSGALLLSTAYSMCSNSQEGGINIIYLLGFHMIHSFCIQNKC